MKAQARNSPPAAIRARVLLAAAAIPVMLAASGSALAGSAPLSATRTTGPGSAPVVLSETGSTLLDPLFGAWATAYHRQHPGISLTTAPTGSGAGIEAAANGTAVIGASDAFLSAGNLVQDPRLLNIPLAISAQQVNYNLPALKPGVHLKLNGTVLALMYQGRITSWDDPAIRKLNPGVPLPATRVVPLHRAESSGDTFLFSSYLSTSDPAWNAAIGYGTTVAWPKTPAALADQGNAGMVAGCAATPGCVAYIGISYLTKALNAGLGEAQLKNAAGRFLLPTGPSLLAAVAAFVAATPAGETISMINGPAAAGYPIVNFEYAIVSTRQPSAAKARALRAFLGWAITAGNSAAFLNQVRFDPLPAAIVSLAQAQIASIR